MADDHSGLRAVEIRTRPLPGDDTPPILMWRSRGSTAPPRGSTRAPILQHFAFSCSSFLECCVLCRRVAVIIDTP